MDYAVFAKLNELVGRWPALDSWMAATARFGPLVYVALLVAAWFAGPREVRRRNRPAVARSLTAAALALAANQLTGLVYFRPRPFAAHKVALLLPASSDPSFPSDHAAAAVAITRSAWGTSRLAGWTLAVLTPLLMVARVYVGLHYPLDVLGGAAVGLLASCAVDRLWAHSLGGIWQRVTDILQERSAGRPEGRPR